MKPSLHLALFLAVALGTQTATAKWQEYSGDTLSPNASYPGAGNRTFEVAGKTCTIHVQYRASCRVKGVWRLCQASHPRPHGSTHVDPSTITISHLLCILPSLAFAIGHPWILDFRPPNTTLLLPPDFHTPSY